MLKHLACWILLSAIAHAQANYEGRDAAAPWRAAAAARIEQHRKGDFTLRVVDATGAPIAGATVSVAQTRHAFPFGSALQMARIVQDSAANRIYRQKAAELFNAATTENDLKWQPWAGEWGASFSRTQTLAGLRWLKERGFELRGHVFVWPSWTNPPAVNLPNSIVSLRGTSRQNEIPQLVLDHIAEQAAATREVHQRVGRAERALRQQGPHGDVRPRDPSRLVQGRARRVADRPLYLNDYNTEDITRNTAHVQVFENTVRYLQQNGAPLTGLGIQAHIGGNTFAGMTNYLATLDRYAAYGSRSASRNSTSTPPTSRSKPTTRAHFHHEFSATRRWSASNSGASGKPPTGGPTPPSTAPIGRRSPTAPPIAISFTTSVDAHHRHHRRAGRLSRPRIPRRLYRHDHRGRPADRKTFSLRSGTAAPTIAISATPPRLATSATRAPSAVSRCPRRRLRHYRHRLQSSSSSAPPAPFCRHLACRLRSPGPRSRYSRARKRSRRTPVGAPHQRRRDRDGGQPRPVRLRFRPAAPTAQS